MKLASINVTARLKYTLSDLLSALPNKGLNQPTLTYYSMSLYQHV